jgi:hypothetical protein
VLTQRTNSVDFSPQANYTDWATATCWRNLVPTFVDRGVSSGYDSGIPTVVNISFLDRSRYFYFFQVAPHLSSQGLSGPRSKPTATQKIWQRWEPKAGPQSLLSGSLTTRPQRQSSCSQRVDISADVFRNVFNRYNNVLWFQFGEEQLKEYKPIWNNCLVLLQILVRQ